MGFETSPTVKPGTASCPKFPLSELGLRFSVVSCNILTSGNGHPYSSLSSLLQLGCWRSPDTRSPHLFLLGIWPWFQTHWLWPGLSGTISMYSGATCNENDLQSDWPFHFPTSWRGLHKGKTIPIWPILQAKYDKFSQAQRLILACDLAVCTLENNV